MINRRIHSLLFILSFALLSFLPLLSIADTEEALWDKALMAYQQEEIDQAETYFLALHQAQPDNVDVLFNLGNVYYKKNDIAQASLFYSKALRRDPGFKAASINLEKTQQRITNRIQPVKTLVFIRFWNWLVHPSHVNTWAFFLFISVIGLSLSMMLPRLRPHLTSFLPFKTIRWLCLIAIGFTGLFTVLSYFYWKRPCEAVVMEDNVGLYKEKGASVNTLEIPSGTILYIEKQEAPHCFVVLPDGRSGWVNADQLQIIQ